jgi:cyclic beta-1,2-glucan synthetase
VDKYRQPSHVQRASLMSATMSDVRWRAWRLSAEHWADIQTLATALAFNLARPQQVAAGEICDRSLLWRFGLSGERPLLLVTAGAPQGLGLLRALAQALRVWSWGGLACDLVVVNAEAATYQSGLHIELQALRDHLVADQAAAGAEGRVALHVLRAEDLSADEASTLHHLARVRLDADGRPLQHHVQAWRDLHEAAFEARLSVSTVALRPVPVGESPPAASHGDFVGERGAFRFLVGARHRPTRPWVNVLANPRFGSLLSEAGGGFTWAGNSRLHQLTAWSNDPVADPPSEWLLLQDEHTRETWSLTPSAWAAADVAYSVTHGQGDTVVRHRHGELEVLASWCVDADAAVRQLRIRLVNHGPLARALRIVSIAEWMMGASRADRATTFTRMHALRGGGAAGVLLLCTQRERAGGFGGGTAFLAASVADAGDRAEADFDWTCDRRECVDARGRPVLPDHFGQRSGSGLDPCAALSLRLRLPAGSATERVLLLGHAESPQAARDLAARATAVPPAQRADSVRQRWDALLGATVVRTPDPLFDVLVNRWLLYQAVSCRLWAKAGFYQAGGATGFRDQLQDSLALAWAAPQMLREQILRCAARQFAEGDVQHWWHAPTGAGVRTHISDDLLWLPHALLHHLKSGGDVALLDQEVPFIEGTVIADGAEDAYDTPRISHQTASVYEHAARAIDHSLPVGMHGLPLMGGGDWNDGMNRVGHHGRGESVWLGWFACKLVAGFAPLARARGDTERAQRWDDAAAGWQGALLGSAWDGHWYLRAFFDDGQALGARANAEARIDLIAQAWAVLSGVAPPQRQREALAAVQAHLADDQAGLLRLLDPPLAHAVPRAGYIQAYPPGVRENGGQYAHAAVWMLMAQARWATGPQGTADDADTVYRWFTWLSPAHRTAHATRGAVYGLEPYAMAGDVCSAPPHTGRGGWSWYTGSAAWMHRAAVESVFGLHIGAQELCFTPCLPSHWPGAELTLQRDGRRMHFMLRRTRLPVETDRPPPQGGTWLMPGQPLRWTALAAESRFVVPLPDGA